MTSNHTSVLDISLVDSTKHEILKQSCCSFYLESINCLVSQDNPDQAKINQETKVSLFDFTEGKITSRHFLFVKPFTLFQVF